MAGETHSTILKTLQRSAPCLEVVQKGKNQPFCSYFIKPLHGYRSAPCLEVVQKGKNQPF